MIEISDLKGFDFSKKYINPAKEYIEITDEYEFKCRPLLRDKKIDGTNFEFKTKFYSYNGTNVLFPSKVIRLKINEIKKLSDKIGNLKNLFPNDDFDVCELYDVLIKKRDFYVSWAILINHGTHIENKDTVKKIIEIISKYENISFEDRFNFTVGLFYLPMEKDIPLEDFKNINKNTILKYYGENRKNSTNKQLLDQMFENQEILEEKLDKFEEYKKFVYIKLDELGNELSKYIYLDDIDLISLFESITYYRGSDEDEQMANKLILKEFGIEELDKLEELDLEELHITFLSTNIEIDFNTIKSQNFDKITNMDFKLEYIYFLHEINSSQNNYMHKLHYFDEVERTPKNYYLLNRFENSKDFQQIPVQYLKDYGTIQNHIIDGKGIGILKFKTKNREMKKVLGKYGLSKTGNTEKLINRILDNLSSEEINKEFSGHRFILTSEGEEILNNFNRYQECLSYIHTLPSNFTGKEFIKICEMNPQYDIEDIIFSIVMNNWIIIEDENLFSKDALNHITHECSINKLTLGKKLTKNSPNKAEILLVDAMTISSYILFPDIKQLCNSYHKQKKYDEELNFINLICEKAKKGLIEIRKFDSQESDWLDKRKNTLYNNLNSD